MKLCKTCGNLLSDVEYSCQKCGTAVEPAYVNNMQQQPQQMQQPMMQQQMVQQQMVQQQPMMQQPIMQITQTKPQKEKKKVDIVEGFKKNYKPISVAIIIALVALSVYLTIDNIALRKRIKLNSTSAVESNYQIKDNTDNTGSVTINADKEEYNFNIPEGTYPKVSQNYVFFVPEEYVATVMEQSGGISLLNVNTGGSGWIGINRATIDAYRKQKDSLRNNYEHQGITVTNIYDKNIEGKDTLVFELIKNKQPSMLIITESGYGDCYILTVTNTNMKTSQDMTTVNQLVRMLGMAERLK